MLAQKQSWVPSVVNERKKKEQKKIWSRIFQHPFTPKVCLIGSVLRWSYCSQVKKKKVSNEEWAQSLRSGAEAAGTRASTSIIAASSNSRHVTLMTQESDGTARVRGSSSDGPDHSRIEMCLHPTDSSRVRSAERILKSNSLPSQRSIICCTPNQVHIDWRYGRDTLIFEHSFV